MNTTFKFFVFTFSDNAQFIIDKLDKYEFINFVENPTDADWILAIGGDGTVLAAKKFAIHYNIPIAGFNYGTLGFLTCADDIDKFAKRLANSWFVIQKRQLLKISSIEVMPLLPDSFALNDIVIENNDRGKLLDIEIIINNTKESIRYNADKIIFATSTGSTAYNLSAGGTILHPDVKAMILIPVAPFSMSSRPIVIPDDYEVNIRSKHDLFIKIDGQGDYCIKGNTVLNIKYDRYIELVKEDNKFFGTLQKKLNWNLNIKR